MKNLFLIFNLLILVGCGIKTNKENHSIIGLEFQNYKQVNELTDYTKISDTVIAEKDRESKYSILHLRNLTNNLIIFKSISTDSINNRTYKILDTLTIRNINNPEFVTIGYCQLNEDNNGNFIAIVDQTDNLNIRNIRKVWRANTSSNKIEKVNNLNEINCINEEFLEY